MFASSNCLAPVSDAVWVTVLWYAISLAIWHAFLIVATGAFTPSYVSSPCVLDTQTIFVSPSPA